MYRLIRERDGLNRVAEDIRWLEFNNDRTFKSKHEEVNIGRSLLMSPFNRMYTWLTTPVTKILEEREDYLKFKTENSTYELVKIKEDENIGS